MPNYSVQVNNNILDLLDGQFEGECFYLFVSFLGEKDSGKSCLINSLK